MASLSYQSSGLKFKRSGGVRQVRFRGAGELAKLPHLDPKDWMALSCPATGHEMDDRTLAAIDTDRDGRLRIREIRQTVSWLQQVLKELVLLEEGTDRIHLDNIRSDTPEGEAIRASIRHLLNLVGSDGGQMDLLTLKKGRKVMEEDPMDGDGILDQRVTDDPVVQELIQTVIATIGPVPTRQGTDGVTRETVESFYRACSAFADWHDSGYSETARKELFILGERTESAMDALLAVEAKIEEWFKLCDTYSYAPDLVKGNLEADELEKRPLAPLDESGLLHLDGSLNPAWKKPVENWIQQTLKPVFGEDPALLSRQKWQELLARFQPYREWRRSQPGSTVSGLGIEGVNRWRQNEEARQSLEQLLMADLALKDEISGVREVERLLLLMRDFWEFLHNFINFDRFYDLSDQALFQVGILYLDGRSFHLCVPVGNQKEHVTLASRSGLYLIYCQLSRPGNPAGPVVAAAVTNGESSRIMIGKHGVFYDREEVEWDARIVQIIEHPINLQQAIVEPFRRLGNLLVSHMERLSTSREKSMQTEVIKGVTEAEGSLATAATPDTPQPPPPPEKQAGGIGGFMAGGGVAIAAVTSSLAFLSSTMAKINPVYFLYAFLSLIALILLPTAIVAWIRLRRRDIGLLLEACGWAINAPMRLTRPLGARLTLVARRR